MRIEPTAKRTVAFVDGQNLFNAAKEAFGYSYPNYDLPKLAEKICSDPDRNWQLIKVYFYTGIPDRREDMRRRQFWEAKLLAMKRHGVEVYSRPLRYRNKPSKCPKCNWEWTVLVGEEKGIDVRIAIDVMRMAHQKEYDVALVFSQDQDLSEVADEIRLLSVEQDRWIKMTCAFPVSPTSENARGINNMDWIEMDRALYDSCLDPRDYRPKGLRETKNNP